MGKMVNSILEETKKKFKNHFINLRGWSTDRKIVVIESDDWGMIRMASQKAYRDFLKKGYLVDECPYDRNDAIESNKDLELLFEVLTSVKDLHGNAAVLTANNVVANPDFKKIRESGFQEYFYEPFINTLKKYPGRDRVEDLYKEGISKHIFRPQFHCREHVNVNRWMAELNTNNKVFLEAFEQNMFTVYKSGRNNGRRRHLDAFGIGFEKEWVDINEVIRTGLNLFEDLWGYRSSSFIAPCYTWPEELEKILAKYEVKYIQGTNVQRVPVVGPELKIKRRYHYMGQENQWGQRYLIRNVYFEPSETGRSNSISKAMKGIDIAFKYKKPAIISSHRVNYMGTIKEENRTGNLNLLKKFLQKIVKKHPEVEFMSSDQLGNLIVWGN